jgi:hypothetical protein
MFTKKIAVHFFLIVLVISFNCLWANREGQSENASVQSRVTLVQTIDPTWLVGRYGRVFSHGDESCIKGLKGCTEFGCEKCRDGEKINGCMIIACCSCIIPTVTAVRCIQSAGQHIESFVNPVILRKME